jgi:hypothetical protein
MPPVMARPRRPQRPSRGPLFITLLLLLAVSVSNGNHVTREGARRRPRLETVRVYTSDARNPVRPRQGPRSRERLRPPRPREPRRPNGRLRVVGGHSPRAPEAEVVRFLVEVERGLRVTGTEVASFIAGVLRDRRSWGGGAVIFRRVSEPPVSFRVALASPATTDRLCAPLDTQGIYSCHQDGRAVLNYMRWRSGAPAYRGELKSYRTYLVNHEVGHALGHSAHRACPAAGMRAPVMMQQTKGVTPCESNPWPLGPERDLVF